MAVAKSRQGSVSPGLPLQTHARFAFYIEQLLDVRGVDSNAVYLSSGINRQKLDPLTGALTADQLEKFIIAGVAAANDPGLGLQIGKTLSFNSFGPVSQAAIACADLEAVITLLTTFSSLTLPAIKGRFDRAHGMVHVQFDFHSDSEVVRSILFDTTAMALNIGFEKLTGSRVLFSRISTRSTHGEHWKSVESWRVGSVEAGANAFSISFAETLLKRTVLTANPADAKLALLQCEAEMRKLTRFENIESEVAYFIHQTLPDAPSIRQIAEQLHLTERTLRRYLTEHGVSFRQLVSEARCELACKRLSEDVLSIEQIAQSLGYVEAASFSTAFKRWTGLSPMAWRRERSQPDTFRPLPRKVSVE